MEHEGNPVYAAIHYRRDHSAALSLLYINNVQRASLLELIKRFGPNRYELRRIWLILAIFLDNLIAKQQHFKGFLLLCTGGAETQPMLLLPKEFREQYQRGLKVPAEQLRLCSWLLNPCCKSKLKCGRPILYHTALQHQVDLMPDFQRETTDLRPILPGSV